MNYRYFANPHAFSDYSTEAKRCDLCSEERAGYNGSFYGTADIEFVCEECLVGGRLQEMGSRTNEADVVSLRKQWRGLFPDHCEAQFESLVRRRTEELEHRTPGVVTWQDYAWPAHCGDYCRYIKEVGLPDLECLSSDGNARKFFQEHLHGDDPYRPNLDNWYLAIRHDSPKDHSAAYNVGVYLFQCLHCDEYVILWDAV